MYNAIIDFAHWIDARKLLFSKQVKIYNVHASFPTHKEHYNVLNIANEPEPTRMSNKRVLEVASYYDLILTWDEAILAQCPNSRLFLCGMTWIREEDIPKVTGDNKQFEVTTFCTSKTFTSNHHMRHRLWNRQKEINVPHVFWNSAHNIMPVVDNNPFLGPDPYQKIDMFSAQFHITIENSCMNNYFSEKLMDCFMTETVPIYIGCPNVGNFFNTDGIIVAKDENDIIEICNNLTPDIYQQKVDALKDNKKRSEEYCRDFTERLYDVLKEYVQ